MTPSPFRQFLPWIALAVTLVLTLYGGYRAHVNEQAALQERFERTVNQIETHLRQRLLDYEQVLRGGVALFMASDDVSRIEWQRYVDHLYISASYPGIQGIGFARQVFPDQREALVKEMQASGQFDFHIYPEGDREVYYPIVYLEPLDWRNQRAMGYDMFSQETRHAAMARARDEGVSILSGKVELVQEVEKGKQAGFLFYLPLYKRGVSLDTREQRREALQGFVYSPFRMGDFMVGSFSGEDRWIPDDELVELEIFDGIHFDEQGLMWASEKFGELDSGLRRDKVIPLYGHHWALRVVARPAYFDRYGEGGGWRYYLGGAFVAFMLFVFIIRAERRREREGAEERFRSLVTTIPGSVYSCQNDNDRTIDFTSPYIFEITGYPSEDFMPPQRKRHYGDLIIPEDRQMVTDKVQEALRQKAPFQLEYRIVNAKGERRWIAERGRGVFDNHGDLDQLTGVLFDVTEQKRAEQELRAAKEAAEGATKVKDQFVNLVAHDLRSPLAAMVGAMQALRSQGEDCLKPEMKGLVDSVTLSGERMSHTIEELLDITRLQTGKIVPRPRFVDAWQVVAAAIGAIGFQAAAKGIIVENRVPEGMRVRTDPELLHEVIQNLLSNSVKFLASGQKVTVSADPTRSPGLLVEDDGPGIEPTFMADLFRHEVKTSSSGTAGEMGTGLGLPYAHDLMVAMGGDLEVESSQNVGARFRLVLPDIRPVVLLVDDEKAARLLLKAQMRELHVDTVEAADGEEALRILAEREIDCVITDLNMPEIDGFHLIRRIKEGRAKQGPPVVVVTADHSMDTRLRIIQVGADDFLTKPVDKNDLIPRLRRFLS